MKITKSSYFNLIATELKIQIQIKVKIRLKILASNDSLSPNTKRTTIVSKYQGLYKENSIHRFIENLENKNMHSNSSYSEIPESEGQSQSSHQTAYNNNQRRESRNKYSELDSEYASTIKTQDAKDSHASEKQIPNSSISKIFQNGMINSLYQEV